MQVYCSIEEVIPMGFYNKLKSYFPAEEMKKKGQLEDLIARNPNYKLAETDEYVVLYGEYEDFIFVDYVLVDKKARGKGIGAHILQELKQKQKNIILEVEPVDVTDSDTLKRERFYLANGFKRAQQIKYYRDIGEKGPELNEMELYYWSPAENVDEMTIRQQMMRAYEDIHLYHYENYFKRESPDISELVQYEQTNESLESDSSQKT